MPDILILDIDVYKRQVLKDKTFQIGEKLSIRRFAVVDGLTSTYVHGGGTIGVIVKAESECADKDAVKAVLKNVALQIAAMNPKYLDKDSVPAADLEAEKEILMAQINNDEKNASKPEACLLYTSSRKLRLLVFSESSL